MEQHSSLFNDRPVSVLLAAYNGERFLPVQLESLAAQTESDFEVLYQDDGSSDGTPEVLASWAERDSRFHPGTEQGRHFGPAGNFFSLLKQTKGDLVLLCDQDDIWEPEKVASLLAAYREATAEADMQPILIHSDASIIDADGTPIAPSFFRLQGWDPDAVTLPKLLVQNNATGCMMLMNRPLVDLVTRYGDPSRMFMHDWFIALTAAAFGRVIFLNRPLTKYRQHGDNTIGASRAGLLNRGWKALQERDQARERIALTYTHTEAFRQAFDEALPAESARLIDAYLATRTMPKWKRIRTVRSLGCLMQSPVTRVGQMLFG